MNKILFNYLLSGYFITIIKVTLILYCFGLILNLFEEIEFFKNLDVSVFLPISLTALYIPSLIIKLLPFIIFISSLWFLLNLRNSKDLLTLKVFGYSNFKIFFILAFTSFVFGWLILFALNPVTSAMVKYYEQKSEYSKDIDYLPINKNGLWIKENTLDGHRFVSADETRNFILKNVTILNLDNKFNLNEKIYSEKADISNNQWQLEKVIINKFQNGILTEVKKSNYSIRSKYDYKKINNLFKNFDTMSFLDLILKYNELQNQGYNKAYLDSKFKLYVILAFFLIYYDCFGIDINHEYS